MLPIVLLQEWPVEHEARTPDPEHAARTHVISAVPVPGEVIGIDPHLLRLRRSDDLHRLAILHRVAPRERPVAANARTHRHRMTILAAPHDLGLRHPLAVRPLRRGYS